MLGLLPPIAQPLQYLPLKTGIPGRSHVQRHGNPHPKMRPSLGKSASKGFTLIELLVTIAVVGVLAGLLFAVAGGASEKANSTKCVANLRQLSTAMNLYVADKGRYPAAVRQGSDYSDLWFYTALPSYLGNAADRWKNISAASSPTTLTQSESMARRPYYYCPSAVKLYLGSNSLCSRTYAMNQCLTRAPQGAIERPSATILLSDGCRTGTPNDFTQSVNWGNYFPTPVHGNGPKRVVDAQGTLSTAESVNVAFCDGHVGQLKADLNKQPKAADTSEGYVPNSWAPYPFWRPGSDSGLDGWP